MEPEDQDLWILTTTLGSASDAQALARAAVEQRLAACAQVDAGVQSVYRWEGKLCEDTEARVTFKTVPELADALREFVLERHPYDLPQCAGWRAQASPAYAAWVRSEVRASGS